MDLSRRAFLTGLLAAAALACSDSGAPTDTAGNGAGSSGPGSTGTSGATGPTSTGSASPGALASSSTTASSSSTSGPSPSTSSGPTSTKGATTSTPAPATFVDRGPGSSDKVALTFHTNGDLGLAQKLVDIFAEHHAVMTNFIVGNWLAANPSWAKTLLDGGHELANHTYTHPTFGSLSASAMVAEITKCRDVIAKLSGNGGRYFRPSGTDDGSAKPSNAILSAAATAGYATVLGWNDEPFDYKDPGADAVRTRVLDQLAGGSIVSLHFGHQGTVDAMPAILDGIASKGLKTATVSDLLG